MPSPDETPSEDPAPRARGSRRGSRPFRRAAALLVAGLISAGCAAPAPAPPPSATPSAAPVAWRDCAFGRCAEVEVPLDHARPDGRTLTLAVAMRPATAPRRGAIFVHPGGPGVSGRERLAGLDRTGLEAYDLIAWDPRGVGGSAAFSCLEGPDADAFVALGATLAEADADAPAWSALRAASARFGQACRDDAGALVDHLDAADQARDLEVLRRRLTGAEPLRFWGASAAGRVGVAYADLFGRQVAALVLDAPLDPRPDAAPPLSGFEAALGRAGLTGRAAAVLEAARAEPLTVGQRRLTAPLAAAGIIALLYGGDTGPLTLALDAAASGDGAPLLTAADGLNGRRPDGTYGGLLGAFRATTCADTAWRDEASALAAWRASAAAAPTLAEAFGPDLVCVGFPAAPEPLPMTGADIGVPVVILASTGDPAAPYAGAQALAGGLRTGVVVTREGEGHGAFGRGAACVDAAAIGALTAEASGFDVGQQRC